MARIRLTPERITTFSCPPGKQQAFLWDTDTPSLAVRVTSNGSKAFIFESKLDRKTIRITIGDIHTWLLNSVWKRTGSEKEEIQRGAREEASRLKTLVNQGIDPREVDKAKKEARAEKQFAIERAKKYTLEKLFEAYCDYLKAAGKNNTARVARSLFKTHATPELKESPAKDVEAEAIADMLRSVTEQGKERTAGALRTYLLAAYNVAMRARLNPTLPIAFKAYGVATNPIALIPAIASRAGNRVLANNELRAYMKGFDTRPTDRALALALLAGGQRMEQLLRATTDDWNADTKTLQLFDPKGRRKEPRVHLLPLASRATAIVEDLVADAGEDKRLFKLDPLTPGKRVKAICEAQGIKETFDLRDVRRTVETRMAALGISKDTRAQVLSHGLSGVQEKHYDRHSYETEKRNALIAWEGWLATIEKGEKPSPKVVSLKRKTAA